MKGKTTVEVYEGTMAEMKEKAIEARIYSHPIGNQGTLIFCNGSPNLQEQLVVWILADWMVQKFDPTTTFLPFFQQQHLVNIVPCQTIWRSDHYAVYFPSNHPVSQAVQG